MADDVRRRIARGVDEAAILGERGGPTCNLGWVLLVLEGRVIALEVFAVGNNTGDDAVSRDFAEEGKCADEGSGLDQRHCVLEVVWGLKRV